jgi:hypothetical protein
MEYQIEMMGSNSIAGLLPVKFLRANGKPCFYYDIGGFITLAEYFAPRKPDVRAAAEVLMAVSATAGRLGKFLLEDDCLVLSLERIFIDPARRSPMLAYLPIERQSSKGGNFVGFVVEMVKAVQPDDSTGKLFCRKILEEAKKPNFSYDGFNDFLLDILCFSKGSGSAYGESGECGNYSDYGNYGDYGDYAKFGGGGGNDGNSGRDANSAPALGGGNDGGGAPALGGGDGWGHAPAMGDGNGWGSAPAMGGENAENSPYAGCGMADSRGAAIAGGSPYGDESAYGGSAAHGGNSAYSGESAYAGDANAFGNGAYGGRPPARGAAIAPGSFIPPGVVIAPSGGAPPGMRAENGAGNAAGTIAGVFAGMAAGAPKARFDILYMLLAALIATLYFACASLANQGGQSAPAVRSAVFLIAAASEAFAAKQYITKKALAWSGLAGSAPMAKRRGRRPTPNEAAQSGGKQARAERGRRRQSVPAAQSGQPQPASAQNWQLQPYPAYPAQDGQPSPCPAHVGQAQPASAQGKQRRDIFAGGGNGKKDARFGLSVEAAGDLMDAHAKTGRRDLEKEAAERDLWEASINSQGDPAGALGAEPGGEQAEALDGVPVGEPAEALGCVPVVEQAEALGCVLGGEPAEVLGTTVHERRPTPDAASEDTEADSTTSWAAGEIAGAEAGCFASGDGIAHASGADSLGRAPFAATATTRTDSASSWATSNSAPGFSGDGGTAGRSAAGRETDDGAGSEADSAPGEELYGLPPSYAAREGETEFLPIMRQISATLLIKDDQREYGVLLKDNAFTIGRQKHTADLALSNKAVGKTHARLERDSGVWHIRDLNSKNGTYINNIKLECGGRAKLGNFDMITVANVDMIFVLKPGA